MSFEYTTFGVYECVSIIMRVHVVLSVWDIDQVKLTTCMLYILHKCMYVFTTANHVSVVAVVFM